MKSMIASEPAGTNPARSLLPFIGALIFFVLLWQLDFPKPFVDDLFYTGAGINLASGGDFSNPLLERQHFPSHYFFVYPPIHSFFLAGFLKIFGVSALSLTGFQILMYLVTSVATMVVLRKNGSSAWLEWLVPLGVCASFLFLGLRPEPLSVALTMTGFALIECGCRRWPAAFVAFLLMFLGGACAPRLTLFSGALVLAATWRLWDDSKAGGRRQWNLCLPVICALAASVIMFLWMIGFHLEEFLNTFRTHAHRVADETVLSCLRLYFTFFTGTAQWPMLLMSMACMVPALYRFKDKDSRCCLFIVITLILTILNKTIGPGVTWYLVLMLFLSLPKLSRLNHGISKLMPVLLGLTLLLANSRSLIFAAGTLSGKTQKDPGPQAKTALQIQSSPDQPILVDVYVARYIFNYKVAPGYLDFYFSAPFPGHGVSDYYHPQDMYLVGPEYLEYLEKFTRFEHVPLPRWRPLNSDRWGYYQKPCEVFVIPAAACLGLKSQN